MKTVILFIVNTLLLFAASSWDPYSATSIEHYRESSLSARFKTNERERFYTSLFSVLKDEQHYGIKDIRAYAHDSKSYIEAKNAFFVYPVIQNVAFGRYTSRAFVSEKNAMAYAKEHKAEVLDFEKLLHVTMQSMQKDEALMHTRFKKRAYPMGQKIYEKQCAGKIDPTEFIEMGDLKEHIAHHWVCGVLDEEKAQAVTLYLWNVKRKGDLGEVEGRIEVREDEKCPVCGMFVFKYPKWAAQIYVKHNEHEHHLSFDGVKDMMKFYFNPSRWGNYGYVTSKTITKIAVSDYYSGKGIDGRAAFYVVRSDIYGPMGHELIPFAFEEEAKTFLKEHKGMKVLRFNDIAETMVYELDIP